MTGRELLRDCHLLAASLMPGARREDIEDAAGEAALKVLAGVGMGGPASHRTRLIRLAVIDWHRARRGRTRLSDGSHPLGNRDAVNRPLPLSLTGRDGREYDHPRLPPCDPWPRVLSRLECDGLLDTLPPRHARVCRRLTRDRATMKDVAEEMGLDVSRVFQIYRRSLCLLRERIGGAS